MKYYGVHFQWGPSGPSGETQDGYLLFKYFPTLNTVHSVLHGMAENEKWPTGYLKDILENQLATREQLEEKTYERGEEKIINNWYDSATSPECQAARESFNVEP